MRNRFFRRLAGIALVALTAACGVHQTEAPPISGPSTLAQSVSITATPDRISQDGASQSSVQVSVFGPNGQPLNGVAMRLDMIVGGIVVDYGTLATKSIVTGSDGKARTVYTAPTAPPPPADQTIATVTIRAIAIGNDAQITNPVAADIRLVPIGVILPPADTPTPAFTVTTNAALTNTPVIFDASSSCGGPLVNNGCPNSASAIATYAWNFGDGTSGTGVTASHSYSLANSYNVTLTVTNTRLISASTTKTVVVGQSAGPTAAFVFSPAAPTVGQTIVFNADASQAAPGHSIVSFSWIFGDGTAGSGFLVSHAFLVAGSYNVTLSTLDDAGQKATASQTVAVTAGGGGAAGVPTAKFTSSPAAPGVNQDIFFNASSSTAGSGHSIASYAWNFGDGSTGTGVTATHAYGRTGSFIVTLVVTDEIGQVGTVSANVAVAAGSSQIVADFIFSPTDPKFGAITFFDATPSSTISPAIITSYVWDFGDGTTCNNGGAGCGAGTGQKPQHTYAGPAHTWVVRLTIIDSVGRTATITKNVPQT